MNHSVRRSYWQLTALLLTAHLAGWAWGLTGVLALNAVQCLHFLLWHRSLRVLEVQVRLLYFALLVLGVRVPGLQPLLAFQLAGLTARLSLDYCLAARFMVLMPWNRSESLSVALVRRVFFTPPGPSQIQDRLGLLDTGMANSTPDRQQQHDERSHCEHDAPRSPTTPDGRHSLSRVNRFFMDGGRP